MAGWSERKWIRRCSLTEADTLGAHTVWGKLLTTHKRPNLLHFYFISKGLMIPAWDPKKISESLGSPCEVSGGSLGGPSDFWPLCALQGFLRGLGSSDCNTSQLKRSKTDKRQYHDWCHQVMHTTMNSGPGRERQSAKPVKAPLIQHRQTPNS